MKITLNLAKEFLRSSEYRRWGATYLNEKELKTSKVGFPSIRMWATLVSIPEILNKEKENKNIFTLFYYGGSTLFFMIVMLLMAFGDLSSKSGLSFMSWLLWYSFLTIPAVSPRNTVRSLFWTTYSEASMLLGYILVSFILKGSLLPGTSILQYVSLGTCLVLLALKLIQIFNTKVFRSSDESYVSFLTAYFTFLYGRSTPSYVGYEYDDFSDYTPKPWGNEEDDEGFGDGVSEDVSEDLLGGDEDSLEDLMGGTDGLEEDFPKKTLADVSDEFTSSPFNEENS